ncbi:alkaline phosphatase family protein [Sphingobium sp. CR28]|uniref:alkaline phosphatase family protein n=1 Tax=Sphingobium sp. CR28 TaxID=3400272 RepID=UPI003FEED18B
MAIDFRRKAILFACTLAIYPTGSAHAESLLLVSIDAMGPDYILKADELGLKVPTLRSFMKDGSYAKGVRGVVPTVTCPSHASIVTGVTPSKHGITGNDPLKSDGFASVLCTFASDIKVDALYDAAARARIETGSVGWLNTAGSPSIKYNLPYTDPYKSEIAIKFQEAMARPDGLLTDLQSKLGSYYQDADEAGSTIRLRFATEIMNRYKPSFMMFHTVSVDHTAHANGPWSVEAKRAMEHEDAVLGEIITTALANDPDTVIAVVSDHGQAAYTRILNINIPLIEAGLIEIEPLTPGRAVAVKDWTAKRWGDAILLKDPLDAAARARVSDLLRRLAADPANGIDRIIEGVEVEKLGGYPGASFVLAMKPGTVLGGSYVGDRLVTLPTTRGTHGYLPEVSAMNASFFIKGKGIKAGQDLGVVDMLRIAPTLAQAMGVSLKDAREAPLPVFEAASGKR